MDWLELVKWFAVLLVGSGGGILTTLATQRSNRRTQEIESSTQVETKKLDELGTVRKELWGRIDKLEAKLAELDKQKDEWKDRTENLEVALIRYASRMEECAELFTDLLNAEPTQLDGRLVRRAETLQKLIANDHNMLVAMGLKIPRIG